VNADDNIVAGTDIMGALQTRWGIDKGMAVDVDVESKPTSAAGADSEEESSDDEESDGEEEQDEVSEDVASDSDDDVDEGMHSKERERGDETADEEVDDSDVDESFRASYPELFDATRGRWAGTRRDLVESHVPSGRRTDTAPRGTSVPDKRMSPQQTVQVTDARVLNRRSPADELDSSPSRIVPLRSAVAKSGAERVTFCVPPRPQLMRSAVRRSTAPGNASMQRLSGSFSTWESNGAPKFIARALDATDARQNRASSRTDGRTYADLLGNMQRTSLPSGYTSATSWRTSGRTSPECAAITGGGYKSSHTGRRGTLTALAAAVSH